MALIVEAIMAQLRAGTLTNSRNKRSRHPAVPKGVRNLKWCGLEAGVQKSTFTVFAFTACATVPHAALADEPVRRFAVTATVSTLYDDNILRRSKAAGLPVIGAFEDFRSSPSLAVDIELPIGRQSLLLAGSAGYDFYARNTQLERERIDLLTGVVLRAGPFCTARITGQFSRQQSDLADFATTDPVSNTQDRRAFDATLGCRPRLGLNQRFGFSREEVSNSDPGRLRGNFTSETVSAAVGFARPSFGDLSAYASIRRDRYSGRVAALPGGATPERLMVYAAGLEYRRDIGSRLKGRVAVGYTIVDPNLPTARRFAGISGSADLTVAATDRLRLQITAGRTVQPSNLLDVSYSIVDSFALSSEYRANRTVAFVASGSYTKRSFRESPLAGVALGRSGDQSYLVSGGVRLSPGGRVGLSVDLTGERRRSEIAAFNFGHVIAAVTARIKLR